MIHNNHPLTQTTGGASFSRLTTMREKNHGKQFFLTKKKLFLMFEQSSGAV
ncbi:MAG: hypothetical protein NZL83_04880 [Candidatus Absconditabacterales bacterium]|nr:hypothetical protein [Candidatus Absconditabacterales bacterium]